MHPLKTTCLFDGLQIMDCVMLSNCFFRFASLSAQTPQSRNQITNWLIWSLHVKTHENWTNSTFRIQPWILAAVTTTLWEWHARRVTHKWFRCYWETREWIQELWTITASVWPAKMATLTSSIGCFRFGSDFSRFSFCLRCSNKGQ